MSTFLVIGGAVLAVVLAILRGLAVDEIRGRIQRRLESSLEVTIESLPAELQAEWGDDWRAELASAKTMPLTATQFVRGVRHVAAQLDPAPALAPVAGGPPPRRRRLPSKEKDFARGSDRFRQFAFWAGMFRLNVLQVMFTAIILILNFLYLAARLVGILGPFGVLEMAAVSLGALALPATLSVRRRH